MKSKLAMSAVFVWACISVICVSSQTGTDQRRLLGQLHAQLHHAGVGLDVPPLRHPNVVRRGDPHLLQLETADEPVIGGLQLPNAGEMSAGQTEERRSKT